MRSALRSPTFDRPTGAVPCHTHHRLPTRPLLEWRTRTHLLRLPNVRIMDGHDVSRLLFDEQGARGSRTPQWLEAAGSPRVAESAIRTNVGYASGIFRRPANPLGWDYLIQTSAPPIRRSDVSLPIEGDRWMVTLYGYHGDHPPTDPDGYLAFARSQRLQPDLRAGISQVNKLTAHDRDAMYRFVSVVHMVKPVSALFAPSVLLRALTAR